MSNSVAEIIRCKKHNVSWTVDGEIDKDHPFRKCITCMAEALEEIVSRGCVCKYSSAPGFKCDSCIAKEVINATD